MSQEAHEQEKAVSRLESLLLDSVMEEDEIAARGILIAYELALQQLYPEKSLGEKS